MDTDTWSIDATTRRYPAQMVNACLEEVSAGQLAATVAARQRSLRDPVPGPWVTLAADLARDPARCLVHTDLHYDNILASGRPGQPWVAIDPAAAVGAPNARSRSCCGPGPTSCPDRTPSPACSGRWLTTASWTRPRRSHGVSCGPSTTGCGDWKTGSPATPCGASG